MVDVRIDYDAIRASRTAFVNMRDVLDGATRAMSHVSGAAVPQDVLRRRLEDLHDSWGGGIDKLARYAEDAGSGLEGILEAFQQLDTELGNSMVPQEGAAS